MSHLKVEKQSPYWVIIHTPSQLRVTTAESFEWGFGAKFGFFNRKRDAITAVQALTESSIDWSQSAEHFIGKRSVVQKVFDSIL